MNGKNPVHIRDHAESYGDPYIDSEHLHDNTACKICGAVYMSGRWYAGEDHPKPAHNAKHYETICPACRKFRDHVPGGVIKMSGNFIWAHRDEILNLIRNESNSALKDNPLERVMTLETVGDEVHITTTNEKLAQRIGRALHKAYNGEIEYKWSEDNKLARINWHRGE